MQFIVDAQLPPALARAPRNAGFESHHVFDLRLLEATDKAIWALAAKRQAVIVSKDEDFVSFRRSAHVGPAVVWLRIGNTANDYLMKCLMPRMSQIVSAIQAGEVLIEINS